MPKFLQDLNLDMLISVMQKKRVLWSHGFRFLYEFSLLIPFTWYFPTKLQKEYLTFKFIKFSTFVLIWADLILNNDFHLLC